MPDNQPLYIEMIGPSGVGKTTVLRLVADELRGRQVFFRGGLRKRLLQNLANTLHSGTRRRRFVEFYRYLRIQKKVPRALALRRAAAVTGMPACKSFIRAKGALLVEEGPVGYLSSCGGYGDEWKAWTTTLLPANPDAQAFYVVLTASSAEVQRRSRLRGRPDEKGWGHIGKEGITAEQRAEGRQYWMASISAAGGHCIEVPTENRLPAQIAADVCRFIRQKLLEQGDRTPFATMASEPALVIVNEVAALPTASAGGSTPAA